MQTAALAIIVLFALWIAAGSAMAILRPALARAWIGRFASSHAVNWAEQAWRGLAGAALLVRAGASRAPELFTVAGWMVLASALALLIVPLRWHAGYAQYWSRRLPLLVLPIAGAAGLAMAGALVLLAWG